MYVTLMIQVNYKSEHYMIVNGQFWTTESSACQLVALEPLWKAEKGLSVMLGRLVNIHRYSKYCSGSPSENYSYVYRLSGAVNGVDWTLKW